VYVDTWFACSCTGTVGSIVVYLLYPRLLDTVNRIQHARVNSNFDSRQFPVDWYNPFFYIQYSANTVFYCMTEKAQPNKSFVLLIVRDGGD